MSTIAVDATSDAATTGHVSPVGTKVPSSE